MAHAAKPPLRTFRGPPPLEARGTRRTVPEHAPPPLEKRRRVGDDAVDGTGAPRRRVPHHDPPPLKAKGSSAAADPKKTGELRLRAAEDIGREYLDDALEELQREKDGATLREALLDFEERALRALGRLREMRCQLEEAGDSGAVDGAPAWEQGIEGIDSFSASPSPVPQPVGRAAPAADSPSPRRGPRGPRDRKSQMGSAEDFAEVGEQSLPNPRLRRRKEPQDNRASQTGTLEDAPSSKTRRVDTKSSDFDADLRNRVDALASRLRMRGHQPAGGSVPAPAPQTAMRRDVRGSCNDSYSDDDAYSAPMRQGQAPSTRRHPSERPQVQERPPARASRPPLPPPRQNHGSYPRQSRY